MVHVGDSTGWDVFSTAQKRSTEQGRLDVLIRRACYRAGVETPSLCGARTEWDSKNLGIRCHMLVL